MMTSEQLANLQAMGYKIEDVGEVWGDEWAGQFRWINDELDGDTFGFMMDSEEEAWADAEQYQRQLQAAIDKANSKFMGVK